MSANEPRRLSLIGYLAKKVERQPGWLACPQVTAVRSVSNCISTRPPNWLERVDLNDFFLDSSPAEAMNGVLPNEQGGYEIHAHRIYTAEFRGTDVTPVDWPPVEVEPLPADFNSAGFDVVCYEWPSNFGCSPLSCNSMATQIATNESCLLPTLESAIEVACRFAREEPEPGPYVVVEVLRRMTDSAAVKGL